MEVELIENCKKGNIDKVKQLVGKGANIRCFEDGPFRYSCVYGTLEVVKYILELDKTIDPEMMNFYGIIGAASNSNKDVYNYLLKKCPNFKPEEHTNDLDILFDSWDRPLSKKELEDYPKELYMSPKIAHKIYIDALRGKFYKIGVKNRNYYIY